MKVLKSDVRRRLKYIGIPICTFIVYVFWSYLMGRLIPDPVISMVAADAPAALFFLGVSRYLFNDIGLTTGERYRFSPMGIFAAFLGFVLTFLFSQGFAASLRSFYPGAYIQFFDNITMDMVPAYTFFSVMLAPLGEEILFRGIFYRGFREGFNRLAAFIVSTALFAAIHGTLVHIPVALALSVMSVWFYELTGSIAWCYVLHALHNLFSVSFSVWTGVNPTVFGVLTVVMLFGYALSFIYMDKTRDFLRKGRFRSLESWVDDQRAKLRRSDADDTE